MQIRRPGRDDGLLPVLAQSIREAPPRVQRTLWLSAVIAVTGVGFAVFDAWTEDWTTGWARPASFALAVCGVLLLGAAKALATAGDPAERCAGAAVATARGDSLDRVYLALPVLGAISALALTLGVGLFLPYVDFERPWLGVLRAGAAAVMAVSAVAALRFVARTARIVFEYARDQADSAARAREEAVEARLAALQAQMNPHFLFNALNTVASLVRTNGRHAESTIENLARVLRRTLDRSRTPLGTVRDEVDFLRSYLAVEQERWGERLRVDWAVDEDTLELSLPPMTLQPLVENALVHSVGSRLEGGRLSIAARRDNGTLRLRVADDGRGFPPRYEERTGLGNLRKRLATLYGEASALRVEPGPGGAAVVVELPARGVEARS